MKPKYDLDKIKFATDGATFQKAVGLYESGKVTEFEDTGLTFGLLIDLLLRLDKKLQVGGVDDSDGTVGGFIEGGVNMLEKYAELDPTCVNAFQTLKNRETCFGWEEPLLKLAKT